jgi:hypothetical protein
VPTRYLEITKEQLANMYEGLNLLESVASTEIFELDLALFGLTQSEPILDAAREAIADAADLDENDVQLSEIAVTIPLSSDTIHYLLGSGLKLSREDFAYMGVGGEGIRTQGFTFSHYKPAVSISDFSEMALSNSSAWVEDFLKQYGNKQPAQIQQNVRRTEEATEPGTPTPAAPATVPTAPAATTPEIPKQTSQTGGLKLADVLEDFLG